jgi:hypothetical protein
LYENYWAIAKKESCMVKENLNSRQRFVKWEQEGHERKIENKIATTLHPASAAITDQRVCVCVSIILGIQKVQ